jgi:molybdopterin-synthase adenylyltransferase
MAGGLIKDILSAGSPGQRPDGTPYRHIPIEATATIARRYGIARHEVEIAALTHQVVPERYVRNMDSLGMDDQITLLRATVAVIGTGGLGGQVIETLARIGVGTLILADGDIFDESNLNRQLLSTEPGLGMSKVESAARRVAAVNSSVDVHTHSLFLDPGNAEKILTGADLVVDCLDTIPARLSLEAAARTLSIPMVSAAVAGTSGQLTVVFPEDPGLAALYGAPGQVPARGIETRLGNLPQTVGLVASLQASETVKVLLNRKGILRNRLLLVDLADNSFDTMNLT